jgi:hypothetical protein
MPLMILHRLSRVMLSCVMLNYLPRVIVSRVMLNLVQHLLPRVMLDLVQHLLPRVMLDLVQHLRLVSRVCLILLDKGGIEVDLCWTKIEVDLFAETASRTIIDRVLGNTPSKEVTS